MMTFYHTLNKQTYIQGMEIRGRQKPPLYKPALWNQYTAASTGEPRTTNACEGYHNAFASLLNCSHPSIWKLMDAIAKDIGVQKKLIADASTGQPPPTKNKNTLI